jgi:pimeloyl-ACP methyl ester carboxylesterase
MTYEHLTVSASGVELDVWRAGTGPTVIVLHRDTGRHEWNEFYDGLSERYDVVVPALPLFEGSPQPKWIRSVTDLTRLLARCLADLEIDEPSLLGLGFGGWVAAEMLALQHRAYRGLVLHAPVGVRPEAGEILDQFLFDADDYVRFGFSSDEQYEARFGEVDDGLRRRWDDNRAAATQVAWRPYMYSLSLPHLISGIAVPCSVLRSERDRIVPESCAHQYAKLLDGAEHVVPGVGHLAELEAPALFADAVLNALDTMMNRVAMTATSVGVG